MRIDSMLPKSDDATIHAALGFLLDDNEEKSLQGIKNYIQYYRQYPYFSRIVV